VLTIVYHRSGKQSPLRVHASVGFMSPSVRLGPRVPTERPLLVRFAKAGGIGKLIDALRNHADQIQASVARLYQTRCFHL